MSSFVMRPWEPVPERWTRSTWCSLAMRRTSGEERSVRLRDLRCFWLRRGGLRCWLRMARLFAGRCGCGADAAAEPPPMHGDDGVDLDCRAFLELDLGEDAGHRRRDFSVDLVGGDFEERLVFLDRSPTFLSHLVMVPSKMDSPICGMTTLTAWPPLPALPLSAVSARAALCRSLCLLADGISAFDRRPPRC